MGKDAKLIILERKNIVTDKLNYLADNEIETSTDTVDSKGNEITLYKQYIRKTKRNTWIIRDDSGCDFSLSVEDCNFNEGCKLILKTANTFRNIILAIDISVLTISITLVAMFQTIWAYNAGWGIVDIVITIFMWLLLIIDIFVLKQTHNNIYNRLDSLLDNIIKDITTPIDKFNI